MLDRALAGVHRPDGGAAVGMGRPSKATDARKEAILTALRAGAPRDTAADHADIDRGTLRRWMDRNSVFRSQVEKAEADWELRLVAQITQEAPSDWRAGAWLLERRRPARWGRHQADRAANADAMASPHSPATHPLDDLPLAEQAARAQATADRLAADATAAAAVAGEAFQ